jgi:hypothetical protein
MFWTRDRSLLAVVMLLAAVGGCAQQQPQIYTPPPLIIDDAMKRREWEPSVALYPNGDTVSGHNRFPIRTNAEGERTEYGAAVFDVAASLVQTIALPFTYIFIPPFAKALYRGEDIPPSYTAMPPMRPPRKTVVADGLVVDPDTLETVAGPKKEEKERYQHYGPMGPGDTEFMSSPPSPAQDRE